ncbi:CoA-acylating methylmalonate-semialdehyde dehydrogenase [Candidatus Formimonas warabiya]|uniref:Methylmalonate-semialdehyde dehydrogenase (Acylating) n=1 Tax=Formimonas warabiya TaxID=1761012 RepID=A0A3G1KM48_FORW1|nr:CoA-acylating methylmalonate-semialdehyde dehydrogenase [Candidatus Formimonas warabiya]ATW23484.1 methylmalonate-semialdehyde dehydrogenase (acylating) [Candidatus Formimonas warabiya]
MVKRLKYFTNGEWKNSKTEKYMPVYNASTGELMAETPCCTREEVNEAIQAAQDAFPAWSNMPVQKRTEIMFNFKHILDNHVDELATILSMEMGKSLDEARGEIFKTIEVVELACGTPMMMQGDSLMEVSAGHDTVLYREPMGVFAGIVPFNFPAMIPFGWLIPLCITTGNTFVLKAASMVPQTGMRLLDLLVEAGLPAGVVNLVTCSRKEAEIVLEHPDIKGVSYIGSTKVGRHIYKTAAANGKRVQALCAAKNHGLVLKDAVLTRVARGIINSGFGCAGERCMALPVVVVEEEIADKFVSYLVQFAKERKIGCAYDPETELGPVINAAHKESVNDWIGKGIEEGATLLLDGRDVVVPGFEKGFFVGPTIFDNVTEEMTIGSQEIFGPVLCIKRVKNFEEGLALMNANEFANGSCIFTQNGYYAREFARRTNGGMVGVNVGIPVPVAYFPFAGHKNSFLGDLHVYGKDGVAFFTEVKVVTSRWFTEEDIYDIKISTWEGTITKE